MDKSRRTFILCILTISTIVPYATTILLMRSEYTIYVIVINVVCIFFLIGSYLVYAIMETNGKSKFIILILIPSLVIMFITGYRTILDISNSAYFVILGKNSYTKLLNDVRLLEFERIIAPNDKKYIRINNFEYGNDSIQTQLKITDTQLGSILDLMNNSGIFSIHKHNGVIYFVNGGFIDSESGYAFSESGERPVTNHAGSVFTWQKVEDNWYFWYAD